MKNLVLDFEMAIINMNKKEEKMRKIILLILTITLTGCSVDYTLTIDQNNALENITINNVSINELPKPAYYTDQGPSEEEENINFETSDIPYYESKYYANYATFTYNFKPDDYYKSTASHTCYESVTLTTNNEGNLLLNTTNYNSCFAYYKELEQLNINIKIDSNIYNVLNNNADYHINDTYTWNINRNNYQNRYIQLEYNKKNIIKPNNPNPNPNTEENNKTSAVTYILVISVILLLLIGIFGLIKYKSVK